MGWGYYGSVVIHLLCGVGCVVVGGGIRLGEYQKCIMRFGFGSGIEYFFVLPLPVTIIHLAFLFSPFSGVPAHHQLSPDLLPLLAYLPNSAEILWRGLNNTSSLSQINLKR